MTLTYLTSDLPGVGGCIKQRPEDFLVQEQPLYEPTGEGEHLYLFIEKKNQTTTDIIRRLAHAFHVSRRDVGYAGLKDKLAITRQHFSIYLPKHDRDVEAVESLADSPAKVLWAARHGNKLRRGHHAGNQFAIRIRDVEPAHVIRAKKILDRLAAQGVPNYIGEQRFGFGGVNDQLGAMLLRGQWQAFLDLSLSHHLRETSPALTQAGECYAQGDFAGALAALPRSLRHDRQALEALKQGKDAQRAVMSIDGQHRDFLVSALQSAMFNHVLDARVKAGLLGKLVDGDLAWKHDNGSVFTVDQATADTENQPAGRVEQLEVSPSGPMWGPKMTQAASQVLQWEQEAMAQWGIEEAELFSSRQASIEGVRRAMRLKVSMPDISSGADEHGPFIQVSFELGRGGFATVVLNEIIKPDASDATTKTPTALPQGQSS